MQAVKQRIAELDGLIEDALTDYRNLDLTAEEMALADQLEGLLSDYREVRDSKAVPLAEANDLENGECEGRR